MLGEFFAVFGNHARGWLRPQGRADLEELPGVVVEVHPAQAAKPREHLAVGVGGGGGAEKERVGDDARRHAEGDVGLRHEPGGTEQAGHERAGRTHGLVDEADRLRRLQAAAEPVVVEHLDDLGVFRAGHRLGELVVVDQHELLLRRVDDVGLEAVADQPPVVAGHGKHRLRRPLHHAAGLRQARLAVDRDHVAGDDRVDELGRANPQHGVERVERAGDHRHPAEPRQFYEPRREREAPGDHEHPDAVLDRRQVDRGPVAADHEQSLGRELPHPFGEALGAHRAYHHHEFVLPLRVDLVLESASEGVVDLLQAGGQGSRFDRVVVVVEEQAHDVEHREHPLDAAVVIHDGDGPQVVGLHPLVDFVKRLAERRGHHGLAAEILGRGADVHDDPWRSDAGPLQHVFGSLVGRSAAGGDGVGPRGPPEEVGVGDGRTDRIRIRIAMPEDEDAHGKSEGCVGWAGRR